MNVRLLMTLPAEHRTSAGVYATLLRRHIKKMPDAIAIDTFYPPRGIAGSIHEPHLRRAAQWFDRYGIYQTRCLGLRGPVTHIVDQGYAHLAFSVGPSRCVVTFHDAVLLKLSVGEVAGLSERPRATIAAHRFSLQALRRSARVITPSQNTKDDLLRFVDIDEDRVLLIPLAADESFRPADQPGSDHPGELRVLSVGHTGAIKNIETTLRVISLLRRESERVRLIRVGEEFTPAQQQLIDRLQIREDIDYRGRLPFASLPDVYRRSDVLLFPSRYEGFGLPVLEAMASGVPVVASNVGSIPEVAGDAALLHDPDDVGGMAQSISEIHQSSELTARMRAAGLKRASEFSWEKTAEMTVDAYRSVA